MRGGQEDGIDWPSTEHMVKPGCIIDKLRNIVKSTFSSDWIVDLPTSTQWEYAAKATTPFDELLSVGKIKVTDEDLYEKFTNNVDLVAVWHHNLHEWNDDRTTIGRRLKNGWGFYDMVGLGFEWCNDWYKNSSFYHIWVKSFADSDGDGCGDFKGIEEKLDYIKNEVKPSKVRAKCYHKNIASKNLLIKLGFCLIEKDDTYFRFELLF